MIPEPTATGKIILTKCSVPTIQNGSASWKALVVVVGLVGGDTGDMGRRRTLEHVTIHGHDVSYRRAGDPKNESILLIHGLAGSSKTWDATIEDLAVGYDVIAPDLLGHGESAKPRGDYSLGAFASGMRDTRPHWLDDWQRYPTLPAVRDEALFFVNPDYLERPTARVLHGAQSLCEQLDSLHKAL